MDGVMAAPHEMQALTQGQVAKLEQALREQGWTRRFTAFPGRVQEYVVLYEAMGMEVRIEDWALSSESDPSCGQCVILGLMKTIFTRRHSTARSSHPRDKKHSEV